MYLCHQQLPEIFGQEHVWSFILGVDNRANTSLYLAACASVARKYGPPPSTRVKDGEENSGSSSSDKPPSGSIHQDMLPQMRRLQKYIER